MLFLTFISSLLTSELKHKELQATWDMPFFGLGPAGVHGMGPAAVSLKILKILHKYQDIAPATRPSAFIAAALHDGGLFLPSAPENPLGVSVGKWGANVPYADFSVPETQPTYFTMKNRNAMLAQGMGSTPLIAEFRSDAGRE
jgi:hypothetical protein